MTNQFSSWIVTNYGWLLSLFVQGFIAYHVFFLSKKISIRTKLEHKEKFRAQADKLRPGGKVYLVNINRYFKDYPSNKQKRFEGYSHIRAEMKSTRFDGIEFFESMPVQVYQKSDGELSFRGKEHEEVFLAFPVGIVPYEWVEYLDPRGDEYACVPQFYCHFKGRTGWRFWKRLLFFGFPYKRLVYYKLSNVYHEGNDPLDMKYSLIDEPISRK